MILIEAVSTRLSEAWVGSWIVDIPRSLRSSAAARAVALGYALEVLLDPLAVGAPYAAHERALIIHHRVEDARRRAARGSSSAVRLGRGSRAEHALIEREGRGLEVSGWLGPRYEIGKDSATATSSERKRVHPPTPRRSPDLRSTG